MEIGELAIVATDDVQPEALNSFASELVGLARVRARQTVTQLEVLSPSCVQVLFDYSAWLILAVGVWALAKGLDSFAKGFGEQLGKNLADRLSKLPKGTGGYDEAQAGRAAERVIDAVVRLKERVPERTAVVAGIRLPNGERITLRLDATDKPAIALSLAKFVALVPAIRETVQSEMEGGRQIEDPVLVLGSDGSLIMKWIDPETGDIREASL